MSNKLYLTILSLGIILNITFSAPKIGNYFLDSWIKPAELDSLARCSFLILDMEIANKNPHFIDSLRDKNPEITIIAYIVVQEIYLDAINQKGTLRKKLIDGIDDSWWLKTNEDSSIVFWPGTEMLNITDACPEANGNKWNSYLADFISSEIIGSNKWDGVYLDNCWYKISWINSKIDCNNDGNADSNSFADSLWENGMRTMLNILRTKHPNTIIVGNGGYVYGDYLNGALFETFPVFGTFLGLTDHLSNLSANSKQPSFNLVNSNTLDDGIIDYREMRFGLTTAMIYNAWFSYDYGAEDHSQHWWFDEYDVDLGEPKGDIIYKNEPVIEKLDFEYGFGNWSAGTWEININIKDSLLTNNAAHVNISGKEEWNEFLKTQPLDELDSGTSVKISFDVHLLSQENNGYFYSILRKGEEYDKDHFLGTIRFPLKTDTTVTLYSSTILKENDYNLILGTYKGAEFFIDNIKIYSDYNLVISREFEKGLVICNPSVKEQTIPLSKGYFKVKGIQDTVHNNGKKVSSINLQPKDGIILIDSSAILANSFNKINTVFPDFHISGKILQINSPSANEISVQIFSLNGKLIEENKFLIKKGKNVIELNNLSNGYYPMRINLGNNTKMMSIIKY